MTAAPGPDVPPLAGYTVGVTAARRADELGALLGRRGATVLHGPAIRIVPLADDTDLLAATRDVLAAPVDVAIATTGIGFRGWLAAAEGHDLGEPLLARLGRARLLARGPKATGAIRAAGLVEAWSPPSESSAELLAHLLDDGVTGKRIAVQLHGEPLTWFLDALRDAGGDVVPIPVYRWTAPVDAGPLHRLVEAVLARQVDALTFTSAPAVSSVLDVAEDRGRLDELLDLLRTEVVVACVGSICAKPLAVHRVPVVEPARARLGALVRALADELPARARRIRAGGRTLQLRGQAVLVDGHYRPVQPAPMAVLRVLAAEPGVVVSRRALLAALPGAGDEHAVETAIARLRTALGVPHLVHTVVKRGYRLASDRVHVKER